jgi:IS30 family transposase
MTADNGKKFAGHAEISSNLGLPFYLSAPFHSWERGSNENLNGLIRQFVPKKSDILSLSHEFLIFIANELNNRPKKRLGFFTPNEAFNLLYQSGSVAFES